MGKREHCTVKVEREKKQDAYWVVKEAPCDRVLGHKRKGFVSVYAEPDLETPC